jgi:hypothetical protein
MVRRTSGPKRTSKPMRIEAENERRLISERTKAALSAKKSSGIRLGNPHNLSAAGSRGRAIQITAADEFAQTVLPVIRAIQAAGTTSFASIADVLNERGVKSARGGKWHGSSVANVLCRTPVAALPVVLLSGAGLNWVDSMTLTLRPGGSATLSVTDCWAVIEPTYALGSIHAGQYCSFGKPLNELGSNELSLMPKRTSPYTGPMSMQPIEHSSTAPTQQLAMVPTVGEQQRMPLPKEQQARADAVRTANARIMRRNSLRMQRLAQKR